ncbi:MAG: hypothetical protein TREMPRED_005127, partial [Tremellales sp. Tagirdzhanova-0007]
MSQKQDDIQQPPETLRIHLKHERGAGHSETSASVGGDLKRRRLNSPSSSSNSITSPPLVSPSLPAIPLLYHLAVSAHHASHRHLQQAFIPSFAIREEAIDGPKSTTPAFDQYKRPETVVHDPNAADKALGLLLLALDLLKAGLASMDLSDKERVAFSLEFGVVAVKVLKGSEGQASAKNQEKGVSNQVERGKLVGDVQDAVASGLFLAKGHSYLRNMRQQLEILNVRLLFMQNKAHLAKRIVRQALEIVESGEFAHRYTLLLLPLEFGDAFTFADSMGLLDEFQLIAQREKHFQVFQLAQITRLHFLFQHRQWEQVASALDDLAISIDYDAEGPEVSIKSAWEAHVALHFMLFRCLWEGRIGNDATVKVLLKRLYLLMDDTSDRGVFEQMRASGGTILICCPTTSRPPQRLHVQVTPPNITYLLTFLTTLVCRRDFMGATSSCKSLVHSGAMLECANVARADEMWDLGFSSFHGPADASNMRLQIMTIRAEVMMEKATALLYRSSFQEASQLLSEIVEILRAQNIWQTHAPQLCLLYAQFAHLLGREQAALRCYRACQALIKPGSELGLVVAISMFAAAGKLVNALEDHSRRGEIQALAARCRASGSAGLIATGYLLGSLTEVERVASKKKLSSAYEASQRSNNN